MLGFVPAGKLNEAVQVNDDGWSLPAELVGNGDLFLLRVHGDSMINAAIVDGDWVAVRSQEDAENGETVVAMIDGEATVKTLRRIDGHVFLMPENPAYSPIAADRAKIRGKVVAVLRRV
jgi:repressor LexA